MGALFEELDWQTTPMGELSLRRRFDPVLAHDVWEAILNDEHLMSTHFTAAEIELGRLGVSLATGEALDILVGGLGLGYTAQAVLASPRVRSLRVIEALDQVANWHRGNLLPISADIMSDSRMTIQIDDFFALMRNDEVGALYDAILVDIDHTPDHHLHPHHARFYEQPGIRAMTRHLRPGGLFALWSDAPPDDDFIAVLATAFEHASSEVVSFGNPLTGGQSSNTIYVAH